MFCSFTPSGHCNFSGFSLPVSRDNAKKIFFEHLKSRWQGSPVKIGTLYTLRSLKNKKKTTENGKGIEFLKQLSFSNSEKVLICTLDLTLLLQIIVFFAGMDFIDDGLEHGFFTFLRIATTVSFVWLAILIASPYWRFILGAGAVLFNPIIQIHLDKEVWLFFDVIAFILLIAASIYHYRKNIANTPAARR